MTIKTTDTAMRKVLLIMSAVCSVAITLLSSSPWLDIHATGDFVGRTTTSVTGDDLAGISGFGDGQITAVAAITAMLAVLASALVRGVRHLAAVVISVGGLTPFAIALFDIRKDWPHSEPYSRVNSIIPSPMPDFDIAAALWVTLAMSVALTLSGLALLALSYREQEPRPQIEAREAWT